MRKQKLPKDFWTYLQPSDPNTYCFWYNDGQLKKCKVATQDDAREFIKRAENNNVAAFACAFVEEVTENQIFACSFKGVLNKYECSDGVQLEIAGANYKLLHHPERKAKQESNTRSVEQWSKKEYGCLYKNAEYHVSWYNTTKHCFEEKVFVQFKDANTEFEEKQKANIPVRLTECLSQSAKVHEIKAACQHWHIGMGNYLEQIAKKTLPVGEIPYAFSNNYLASEMKVEKGSKYGYFKFRVGIDNFLIQISRACDGTSIMVATEYEEVLYWVIVQDNSIMKPWLAKIDRGW